ncbi:unnamed protein product [Sphagnum jensenii]
MGVDINKDEVIMCDTSALLLLKKDDITSLKQNHEAECREEKTDEIMAVQIADGSNMPTFEVPRVTGAGGFIASWIVKLLRQEGYHVQAAVCNLDNEVQSEHLKNMKGDKEWLELVKADVLDYAAMLAAVDGMKVCSIKLALLLATSLTPRTGTALPKPRQRKQPEILQRRTT